jgi:serine/threonine-protein kinase
MRINRMTPPRADASFPWRTAPIMHDDTRLERPDLPLYVLDRIDRICDRFEAGWKRGERPRIEDALGEIAAPHRGALLRDLVAAEIVARRRRGERPESRTYRDRFPGDSDAVEAAFGAPTQGPGPSDPAPDAQASLLIGLLGFQTGLIDQSTLVEALRDWIGDKARPLAEVLAGQGALDGPRRALLEALAAECLKQHGGDVARSLAALPAGPSTRDRLARLADPDIDATMAQVGDSSPETGAAGSHRAGGYSIESAGDGQRFRVLRPHARGGLGAVFVALDTEVHREVALKRILDQHADDPASRSRFLAEAEITGGLEHPGIVPVYGLGTYGDGRPYYAMRFVKGDSLKEAIENFQQDEALQSEPGRRSLELRKLLRRFVDVCNAINYAHSRGVLHRDIKPGNIIVGRYGETLVVDWGLAKAVGGEGAIAPDGERPLTPQSASGSAETAPGSALGTPAFMSPEQAAGELDRLGPRSDVYSLGATLYCLLVGRPPFESDDVGALMRAVRERRFPPPRAVDSSIDPALDAICMKAMALRPEGRHESARALADDIERWMADEPVSAWREPWSRRLARWQRLHRAGVMAAGAAVLVALAGLGVVLVVQAWANDRLKAANTDLAVANARVIRANAGLQAANAQVQARYELAMDAIRTFHTGVSEDFLLKEPNFQGLRDRLLNSASEFYGKLGAMLGRQTDLASRRAVAQAGFEVAELTAKVGRQEVALAAHRRVLADREALAGEHSSDEELQADVGLSLLEVGRLLAEIGRTDEGLAALDRARAVLRELADDHPEAVRYRDALARAHHYTGDLHWAAGRYAESAEFHGRARAIWEALAEANPAVGRFRNDRARSDLYRGANLFMLGRTADARGAFERAKGTLQELADANPTVPQFQVDLAASYNNIGILLSQAGRPTEALAALDRAVAITRKLVDANPAVGQFQSNLANLHNETGDALRLGGRMAEARASYEQALAALEVLARVDPGATRDQLWLVQGLRGIGATQLAAGRTAEAAASWRRAATIGERLGSDYRETLYYLAGCHALIGGVAGAPGSGLSAAEGPAELDRAMGLLRRAVAAGYRSIDWMRRDPDLDGLRGRRDFQLLMMDLAMPVDPFAG